MIQDPQYRQGADKTNESPFHTTSHPPYHTTGMLRSECKSSRQSTGVDRSSAVSAMLFISACIIFSSIRASGLIMNAPIRSLPFLCAVAVCPALVPDAGLALMPDLAYRHGTVKGKIRRGIFGRTAAFGFACTHASSPLSL